VSDVRVSKSDPELGARRCKSCGALILWTLTEAGKPMPVDFAPSTDGTVAINVDVDERGRRVWRSRVAQIGEPIVRRKSHFATCPNAGKHRKRHG
jgi:hypothetical protein